MSTNVDDFLEHHGVKGMKWGVSRSQASLDRSAGRAEKKKAKVIAKAKTEAENQKRREADDKSIVNSRKALERGSKQYEASRDKYRQEKKSARVERKLGNKEKAAEGKRAAKAAMKDAESKYIQNIVKNQSNAERATSKERADLIIGAIGTATVLSIAAGASAALEMANERR